MSLFSFVTGTRPPLIRQAVASVDAMLAVSGEMFDAATATLLDNEPMDMDLAARDREVNAREQEVRRLVLEHLAVDPLRERVLSLILVAAVQEAERLGDLAKDLERIAALAQRPRLGRHVGPLREARDRIAGMTAAARTAFTGDDAVAAQFVTDEHERIKDLATAYLDGVAHARDLPPNEAVVYALAMRVMSRVSSHLANIVSAVLVPFDQIRRPGVCSTSRWRGHGASGPLPTVPSFHFAPVVSQMRDLPGTVRTALDRVAERDGVSAFDVALGRLLAGLDAEHAPSDDPARARLVALSAALVSAERRRGHSAVALADWAGQAFPGDGDPLPPFPALADWRRHLAESPVVGAPDAATPLVLDGDRLALARFWHAERRVAAAVRARLAPEATPLSEATRAAFAALFPAGDRIEGQALAAAAALRQRMVLVAGGPGTGKTYTATRLLAVLLAAHPGLRVALAAPTGKAAQRLSESLTAGRAALPEPYRAGLPAEAVTLHRLLGYNPARGGFAYTARRPLPADLVLVDEGSMVDLPLFDALLAALAPEARLVLLGDPDQLASVEAGAVFADLCAMGEGTASPTFAAFCDGLGLPGVPSDPEASPLADAVVTLTESRRFGADSGVGRLAAAVRAGDAAAVRAVLADPGFPEAAHASGPAAEAAVAWALPHARAVVTSSSPEEALARLDAFRLLAVVRRGPRGVEGLNAAVEAALRAEGAAGWSLWAEPFYDGRPLLITANDDATRLANGDVGVCWTAAGERAVYFPDGTGGVRRVPYGRLPEREPAWALTVHKSQGSEFDAVGVVLPEAEERGAALVTRELVYTAVTRARSAVVVFGPAGPLAEAPPQRRTSGLRERLAER